MKNNRGFATFLTLFAAGVCLAAFYYGVGHLLPGLALMAVVFPGNCSGRIVNVSASTGCTLTRASIVGLTPEAFAALGFQETGFQTMYAKAREARLAGYQEQNLV